MARHARIVFLCLSLALILALQFTAQADQTGNLIINPGAEPGSTAGWFDSLGNGYDVISSLTHSGAFSFWGGVTGPTGALTNEIRQDVDVSPYSSIIDAGAMSADFESWGRSNEASGVADNGSVIVEYRAGESVLASYSSGDFRPTNEWVQVVDARAVPIGTRTIRVRLLARRSVGASTDAGQDDILLKLDSPMLDVPSLRQPFSLGAARPNPSRAASKIDVTLEQPMRVELAVFDVRGRLIRSLSAGRHEAGRFSVGWDGLDSDERSAAPGLYFYAGRIGDLSVSRRVVIVR